MKIEEIEKLLDDGWQFHYAPVAGNLALVKGNETQKVNGWAEHHENMAAFLQLQKDNKITHADRETYGHSFFHGHRGQVDVYIAWPKK